MTTVRPEQPAPDYVPAHDLLRDKVVVVTAAAGAGIGAAVVRRVLEEGARAVVLGDTHERRLAEAEESLAAEFGADRVRSLVCDVTDEAQVQALVDAADELGGVDVMINNAGLGGTASVTGDDRRAVVARSSTSPSPAPSAASARPANKMIAAGTRGVIVNNASVIGWRAQEGQAHYAAAKAGVMALTRCAAHRRRPARHPGQRGLAEPGDAPVPGQGDLRRAARRAQAARGVRSRGRAVGGRQRDGVPGQRLLVVPDRRGRSR